MTCCQAPPRFRFLPARATSTSTGRISRATIAKKCIDGNCGRAAVGTMALDGTVRVSVPCVADAVARLAARRGGIVHPALAMARHDDVLGAVVAHELGHVFGLRHGDGLMRARLDPGDLVALRSGTLGFTPLQGARDRRPGRLCAAPS